MLLFAYYLLKVSLVSGLLYSYYLIALRNKKFHQYNRFYLLLTVVLSLIIPLLKIRFWKETAQQEMPAIKLMKVMAMRDTLVVDSLRSDFGSWILNNMFSVTFSLISVTFLAWLIAGIIRIGILIRSNPGRSWNNINFIFAETKGTPFSFFKYIFWNKNIDLQTEEGKLILQHELTHVHEKHSADKLFIQLALVISWPNPFFWIIRKELNMIHEFIADEKAVSDGDVNSFSGMLLKTAYPNHSFTTLTNSFFHSPIKRRLLMFTTSKNPSHSYLRRLLILPLLIFVIVFFSFKKQENSAKASDSTFEKVPANENSKSNITGNEKKDTNIKTNNLSVKTIADTQANAKSIDTTITNKLIALTEAQMSLKNPYKKDNTSDQITNFLLDRLASEKHIEKKANPEIIKFLEDVIAKRISKEHKEAKEDAGINKVLEDLIEKQGKEKQNELIGSKEDLIKQNYSDTIEAKFPGGIMEWKKYLETNLNANVPVTKDKAPFGDYTVKLQFIVTETGEINSISAAKVPARCPSCAIEAVRIIKKGPKWDPMTIDGKKVTSKLVQFISFRVQKD